MLTVLHASDLQCGRPFQPAAAEALVRLAESVSPDLVVVSGDLTQRAKRREYELARTVLHRLPRPQVVTLGNHDVPLYRVWERLLDPYRNWRRSISPDLDSVTSVPGATFVALNSAAPRRAIVNGRVRPEQVEYARRAFRAAPSTDTRALVIHHHFVPVSDGTDGGTLPAATELAQEFEDMDVDFVLGGHVHQTHVTTSSDLLGQRERPGVPLINCGTTTSWRGRGPEAGLNSLNVVHVTDGEVEVVPHLRLPDGHDFEPSDPIVLPRRTGRGRRASGTREASA